jgi:Holliday junction resolvase RusA-like endonuclease
MTQEGLPMVTASSSGAITMSPEPGARRRVEFFAAGEPRPMGSKTAFVVHTKAGPRAVVTDGSTSKPSAQRLRSWKDSVTAAAFAAMEGSPINGPVRVTMAFTMPRPAGHWTPRGELRRSAPASPAVKPDLDKLARQAGDCLRGVVIADDSRIVELALTKAYATPQQPPGARIVVEEL